MAIDFSERKINQLAAIMAAACNLCHRDKGYSHIAMIYVCIVKLYIRCLTNLIRGRTFSIEFIAKSFPFDEYFIGGTIFKLKYFNSQICLNKTYLLTRNKILFLYSGHSHEANG